MLRPSRFPRVLREIAVFTNVSAVRAAEEGNYPFENHPATWRYLRLARRWKRAVEYTTFGT